MEPRGCATEPNSTVNPKGEELMNEAKPFLISKREVWEAYQRVKANKGAAGIDEQSIAEFEKDLKDNLYKLWNRMSSGSYFPPPVRTVKIPKASGGGKKAGDPDSRGSDRPDRREGEVRTTDRTTVSSQFVWLSSTPIRIGCGWTGPTELLGL
jgi:hypothetical protein